MRDRKTSRLLAKGLLSSRHGAASADQPAADKYAGFPVGIGILGDGAQGFRHVALHVVPARAPRLQCLIHDS
jgi:hypothetical protein